MLSRKTLSVPLLSVLAACSHGNRANASHPADVDEDRPHPIWIDFGDKRGRYTPRWWKLAGSQYGRLVTWRISERGSFVDRTQVSKIDIGALELGKHHSIRLRVGIDQGARNPGGVNIFGKGFGNHDQDILMRMHLAKPAAKAG